LFAEHQRGPQVFAALLRQMTRWADDDSDQGPVYLGYRLAFTKGAGRTFRALVYNKAAITLHMLRRMMGDEAFFRALRRFYADHRFEKAGTDDLQRAFEAESNRTLSRFFDDWIVGQNLPTLSSSWAVAQDGSAVTVKLTQAPERVFEFPVTVSLAYANGVVEDQTVIVTAAETTATWPIKGRLARVLVNRDRLTPLEH
jgi:aminopeptidase N